MKNDWLLRRTLCIAVLVAVLSSAAAGEEALTLKDIGLNPRTSRKGAGFGNPLYTQRFGADPGVMEYGGRLYVFMTNDVLEKDASGKVRENSYSRIRSISLISSDDLVNWTDHGLIPVAGAAGIAKWAGNSWAPCAAHKVIDGKEKFFLYFCNGGNGIGVLTADSPTGPWKDELGRALVSRSTPNCSDVVWLFDPAVMVDEDGTGYLAFGGGVPEGKQAAPGTGRIVRLGGDMLSLACDPVRLDVPYLFEDSGINRVGDKYVYSYCSNWQTGGNSLKMTDGAIQYMTADDPLGPYTYAGELFPNQGRFFGLYGNNHHSIVFFEGQYYLFYHNRALEKALKITGNYRSPQADRIALNDDGSFRKVTGTMIGLEQLKPADPYAAPVSGLTMSHQAGVTVRGGNGNARMTVKDTGWIRVSGVDFGEGSSRIRLQAACAGGGRIYVLTDSLQNPIAAEITVPAGEEPGEYTAPLAAAGVHDVYFVFSRDAVLGWWQAER